MDIIIEKPVISYVDKFVKLSAKIRCLEENSNGSTVEKKSSRGGKALYYMLEKKWERYICDERADAFLVAILPYAMAHFGESEKVRIICEAPLSERLYYQLNSQFIPILSQNISFYHPIEISATLDNSMLNSENAVGTGISGGIDSYYSLLKSLSRDSEHYKVTHGLFCEVLDNGDYDSEWQIAYRDMAKNICKSSGIEFVHMVSNICPDIYDMVHEVVVTCIFISYVLVLQKLFHIYYFSSAYTLDSFAFTDNSSEHFDLFNMSNLGTQNVQLYLTGSDATRVNKTRYLANFELPKKYLMVCRKPYVENGVLRNCSHCSKCTRTMIDLDLADSLSKFDSVFDVKNYFNHQEYYWGYLFFKGKSDQFVRETLECAKKRGKKIRLKYRLEGWKKIVRNGFKRGNPLSNSYRP